jgi:hypothetical protein
LGTNFYKTKKPIWVRGDDIPLLKGFDVCDIKKVLSSLASQAPRRASPYEQLPACALRDIGSFPG